MRGAGSTYLQTTALSSGTATAQQMFYNPIFSFTYSADVTALEAQGMVDGQLQTVASAQGATTHNFTIETQLIKRATRPLLTGHISKSVSAYTFPTLATASVPTSSPYEIAVAAVTTGNIAYIKVFDPVVGPLAHTADATTAPTSTSQVQVDTTNNKLIFHSGAAGRTISYTTPYSFTGKGYGGSGTATSIGTLAFRGKVFDFGDEEALIEFPQITLVGITEMPVTGDVPTYSLAFLAAVPDGWTHPYQLLELATAS